MASPAASWIFLLPCVLTASSSSAATFTITNNCSFTMWPAAIPIGGGKVSECKSNSNYQVTFCP
nr:unnamed protein product [Digitaria exilis]